MDSILFDNAQFAFVIVSLVQICIGFFCAVKVGPVTSFWVRLIIASPGVAACLALWWVAQGWYVAYLPDTVDALITTFLYLLIASLFTDKPWIEGKGRQS